MLVENSVYRNAYDATGNVRTFTISFPFLDASHIAVYQKIGKAEEVKVPASQYTISGAGDSRGGTLTMNTAPMAGTKIVILRDIPITQLYNYTELDNFPAESHENALAKLTMICQQLAEKDSRHLAVPPTSERTPSEYMQTLFEAVDKVSGLVSDAEAVITRVGEEYLVQLSETAQALIESRSAFSYDVTVTISETVAENAIWVMPVTYVVGAHMLLLSFNGVQLYRGQQYDEEGELGKATQRVRMLMPMYKGDQVNIRVVGVAQPEFEDAIARAEEAAASTTLSATLAEASASRAEEAASRTEALVGFSGADGVTCEINADGKLVVKDVAFDGDLSDLGSTRYFPKRFLPGASYGDIDSATPSISIDDFDAVITPGVYHVYISNTTLNTPEALLDTWAKHDGVLEVLVIRGATGITGNTRLIQRFYPVGAGRAVGSCFVRWGTFSGNSTTIASMRAWQFIPSSLYYGDGIKITGYHLSVPEFEGADETSSGSSGLIPPPEAGGLRFLGSDGTWYTVAQIKAMLEV